MARIRVVREGDVVRVVLVGHLSANDMGRLEQACSPALTTHPPPLRIDLRGVTSADRTAIGIVGHLEARGAQIMGGLDRLRIGVQPDAS